MFPRARSKIRKARFLKVCTLYYESSQIFAYRVVDTPNYPNHLASLSHLLLQKKPIILVPKCRS